MICLETAKAELCDGCSTWLGHAGAITVRRDPGREDLPFFREERIWSIPRWGRETTVDRGDVVQDALGSWKVNRYLFAPPCNMVVWLSRLVIACPMKATIYRVEGGFACLDTSESTAVVQDVDVALKHLETVRRFEFDAEVCLSRYEVYLAEGTDVSCNTVIVIGNTAYKVETVIEKGNLTHPPMARSVTIPWTLPNTK